MDHYNVVWLDDQFGQGGMMDRMFDNFLDGQKKGMYDCFHIQQCTTAQEMKEIIRQHPHYFHAAILDVLGKTDENDSTTSVRPFFDVYNYLKQLNEKGEKIIVKVFSAELKKEMIMLDYINVEDIREGRDFFPKGPDYFALFDALKSDLKNSIYVNYPDLLRLFEKKYLPDSDKQRVDHLMEDFAANNTSTNDKGYLRDILQSILESLVYKDEESRTSKQIIPEDKIKEDINKRRFGQLCSYLTFNGKSVPVTICPKPVKEAVQYLYNMSNILSHPKKGTGEELDKPYYKTLMLSVYPAMIEVLLWYYYYMES